MLRMRRRLLLIILLFIALGSASRSQAAGTIDTRAIIADADDHDSNNDCAICFGAIDHAQQQGTPMLGHCTHDNRFHPDCLHRWLRARNTCPVCRQPGIVQAEATAVAAEPRTLRGALGRFIYSWLPVHQGTTAHALNGRNGPRQPSPDDLPVPVPILEWGADAYQAFLARKRDAFPDALDVLRRDEPIGPEWSVDEANLFIDNLEHVVLVQRDYVQILTSMLDQPTNHFLHPSNLENAQSTEAWLMFGDVHELRLSFQRHLQIATREFELTRYDMNYQADADRGPLNNYTMLSRLRVKIIGGLLPAGVELEQRATQLLWRFHELEVSR